MARKNDELIERGDKVGEGTFGTVYIGRYRDHKEVGIKDIKGKISDEALKEANILKTLTHPNIIRYIDIVQARNLTSIIMEFVDGGSLDDYIQRTPQSSAYWKTTRNAMLNVAHGMSYLHEKRIVHADLKSMNVLLRHDYTAVICDFGLARTIVDSQTVNTSYASGTIFWFAPELCFEKPERSSFPSDVWAFGCILLEITSKRTPWTDTYRDDHREFLNALSKPENAIIFDNICLRQKAPERLRALLCRCCTWQKSQRPDFRTIAFDLFAISDVDLQNINQGTEKSASAPKRPGAKAAASLPTAKLDHDVFETAPDKMGALSQDNPKSKRKGAASLPIPKLDHDVFETVSDKMGALSLDNPKSKRKPAAKNRTDSPTNPSTNDDNTKYDPEHDRRLYKGPRGGWYYLTSNGTKIYLKTD